MRDLESTFLADAVQLDDTDENLSAWVDVSDAETLTLLLGAVETGTAGDLTVKLQAAMESAKDLNDGATPREVFDVPMFEGDVDAQSKVFSASGDAILYRPPGMRFRSARISYQGAATIDGSNYWVLSAQLNLG